MTSSELKRLVELSGNNRYFFTRKTMQFFGDTMRNYGVTTDTITTPSDEVVDVYVLYRRKPVKHGLQGNAYFRKSDLNITYKKGE